ncbi:hypothetical protein OPQ81_008880 [Rhizoctonia solani]|nr:hypothetical protein OPQ81_008880 [Rhizoctonia solani]
MTLPLIPDFDRFDFYAHYIRNLEIYSPKRPILCDRVTLTNWAVLAARSRGYGLLPNLSQLTLSTFFGWADDSEPLIWARTFMSPSLTAIHITAKSDRHHHLSFPIASTLLRHAVSNCPQLRMLSLVTSDRYKGQIPTNLSEALMFWEPSYYESLSYLPLRELCCSTGLLLSANIHTLSKLQFLERLKLYSGRELPDHCIPSPGFKLLPRLGDLTLIAMYWSDIINILEMNIYSGVKSLIVHMTDTIDDEPEPLDDASVRSLAVLVARCCPDLTNLEIDCGNDYAFSPEDITVFEALLALPLRAVSLVNISVPPTMLEKLLSFFPLASTIRMPDSPLKIGGLHYFFRLPQLVHLAIDLNVWQVEGLLPLQVDSTFEIATNFHTLEITTSPGNLKADLSPLAGYLLSIWPNLKQVIWTGGPEPEDEDHQMNTIIVNALNALISAHRILSAVNQY